MEETTEDIILLYAQYITALKKLSVKEREEVLKLINKHKISETN